MSDTLEIVNEGALINPWQLTPDTEIVIGRGLDGKLKTELVKTVEFGAACGGVHVNSDKCYNTKYIKVKRLMPVPVDSHGEPIVTPIDRLERPIYTTAEFTVKTGEGVPLIVDAIKRFEKKKKVKK